MLVQLMSNLELDYTLPWNYCRRNDQGRAARRLLHGKYAARSWFEVTGTSTHLWKPSTSVTGRGSCRKPSSNA